MMEKTPPELDALRGDIDRLDDQIAALLRRRLEVARRIGEAKKGAAIFDAAREASVRRRVQEILSDVPSASVHALWREIFALCRDIQRPLRALCLGPDGSFSSEAARRALGAEISLAFCPDISEVFRRVERGDGDLGVVPIENSVEGAVLATLDAFAASSKELRIQQELSLEVRPGLASRSESLEEVREVLSHPQALAQCRQWLRTHLPGVPLVAAESTSAAAERAARTPEVAAICSPRAMELHGLNLLADAIQDRPDNTTRFWFVGRGTPRATAWDKTSLLFNVRHEPGALFRALEPLHRGGRNLTHIQSRPLPGNPFEYLFFVDFVGHEEEEPTASALAEMKKFCTFFRVLGSYPLLAEASPLWR